MELSKASLLRLLCLVLWSITYLLKNTRMEYLCSLNGAWWLEWISITSTKASIQVPRAAISAIPRNCTVTFIRLCFLTIEGISSSPYKLWTTWAIKINKKRLSKDTKETYERIRVRIRTLDVFARTCDCLHCLFIFFIQVHVFDLI